jgi:hypothetical protein
MRTVLSLLRPRAVWLLGLMALGVAQTGCAQPIWIEPSVVLQARVGGPVYGPAYGQAAVVVAPPQVWMPPPPPMVMAPPVVMPGPIYRPGWWGGRREHEHEYEREHGHGHGRWGWR